MLLSSPVMDRVPHVTILSSQHCPLCQAALELARRLQPVFDFRLDERDISDDPELRARYGLKVPVLVVDGAEVGWGQVTEEMLREAVRREIKGARWRRSISRILSRLVRPRR
jgi:glutaredoxin